jgi:Holliday junction resolvase-like predicted endonuclease
MIADGVRAEEQAARFLAGRGLKILARNYRCRGC